MSLYEWIEIKQEKIRNFKQWILAQEDFDPCADEDWDKLFEGLD